jgi:uncharacterized RDD family membrane protein YckC
MALITIGTPFNIDLEFRIAPFSKRLMAWLIDIVVICLYFYVMLRLLYPMLEGGGGIGISAFIVIIILPVLLYQLSFELFFNGQTIGKRVAGIAVIDMEGREPTWGQYITRWVLCIGNLFIYIMPYIILRAPAFILFFLFLYVPDFLSVVISAKAQRIGDFAAGTVVIDRRYVPDISQTIYLEVEEKDYQPMFPQVMRLSDRDINGIRNLISVRRTGKDAEAYTLQVVEKIKKVLDVESELEPMPFLQRLLADYNYLTRS